MAAALKAGDKAYIVESNRIIRETTIVRASRNLYVIRFENGGGIQVLKHRLFPSKEEAEDGISKRAAEKKRQSYHSPYDYM